MFYTDEEVSVITGLLNAYLVREHASEKVRESYTRISEGLQSHALTRDDYVWLENVFLFFMLPPYPNRPSSFPMVPVAIRTPIRTSRIPLTALMVL